MSIQPSSSSVVWVLQLKPGLNRQLNCRSTESSEQTAWRVFGFTNACSTERTPGKTPSGTTAYMQTTEASLRSSTGIKAVIVKAIRKKIVKDCTPATSDQARVIGVEPVVERMGLDLSIDQLRVRSTFTSKPPASIVCSIFFHCESYRTRERFNRKRCPGWISPLTSTS